jgi:hypothetical protein
LGLAVTYGIMQEHAGKIQVESEVGVGTLFQLDFPAAEVVPATSAATSAQPPDRTPISVTAEQRKPIHA